MLAQRLSFPLFVLSLCVGCSDPAKSDTGDPKLDTESTQGEDTAASTSSSQSPSSESNTATATDPSSTESNSDSVSSTDTSSTQSSTSSTTSPSSSSTDSGTTTTVPAGNCGPKINIPVIVRDFSVGEFKNDPSHHDDFQIFTGSEATKGLVQTQLVNLKPVASDPVNTQQMTSAASFSQWYTDVPGVNHTFRRTLEFVETKTGFYEYDNSKFFPLGPDEGWGKQQFESNFGFTTEIVMQFKHEENQSFTFRGDDDLWLFIEGKLALDIGGLHPPVEETLDLDAKRDELGLVVGKVYTMRIFHAERRASGSNFKVQANIGCFFEPG